MPGPGTAVVRRPHRKSRNGCASCKRRKVKCDETKPICLNCTRHELQCEFKNLPKAGFPGPGTPDKNSPATFSPAINVTDSYCSPQGLSPQGLSPPIQIPTPNEFHSQSLNMAHLELVYHYCTTTCHTLSWNPVIKSLYQTTVLKLGLTCDFVMRSILAISAIHLARLKPERKDYYLSQAMDLHHMAVLEGSSTLSSITAENCTHLYLFSTLTFMFELARPRQANSFCFEEDNGVGEWLLMFRGTRIVIESSNQPSLRGGPLGPMFEHGRRRAEAQANSMASGDVDHLWVLQQIVNDAINHQISDPNSDISVEDLKTYNEAIDDLRRSYNIVYNQDQNTYESTDVFIWLYRTSENYLRLLGERRSEALAIFAYYCVLLKQLDTRWWVHGWSTHLISQIYGALGEEHRLWITWPIREIGWIP